jgi:hypothetical protein
MNIDEYSTLMQSVTKFDYEIYPLHKMSVLNHLHKQH